MSCERCRSRFFGVVAAKNLLRLSAASGESTPKERSPSPAARAKCQECPRCGILAVVSQDSPGGKKTGNWGAGDRKPFPGHVVHWGQWGPAALPLWAQQGKEASCKLTVQGKGLWAGQHRCQNPVSTQGVKDGTPNRGLPLCRSV